MRELAETAEGTMVFDAHDRQIFAIPTQYRVEVELARMSPHLRDAVIAVEDTRFYDHDGIDGIRVIGAVVQDIRQGRAAEGASTITQQLARVSFLTRDKTLRRKLREAILAQRIEKLYSKDEILEIYLNKVYFGDGLYGAEAAARGYFGKPASDLTVAEAAMLAGIIRAPSASNPTTNLERAVQRRNVVLKLMRENDFIDQAEHDAAVAETVALHDDLRREDPTGLHFKEILRRQLIERFGKDAIYTGTPARLHDDRPRHAEGRRGRGGEHAARDRIAHPAFAAAPWRGRRPAEQRAAPGLADCTGSGDWRSARDRGRPRHGERRPESRAAVEAPARVGLQAVRLRGGDREWILARERDRSIE